MKTKHKKSLKNKENLLLNNSNFLNSQNYILGKKEKYVVTNNIEDFRNIQLVSFFISSPIILLFFGIIWLFLKEIYENNRNLLRDYLLFLGILSYLIWIIFSGKIYKYMINKKKYILYKINVNLKKIDSNPEKYYDNFIFKKLNNSNFSIIKKSKFITEIFASFVYGLILYFGTYLFILLPLYAILGFFIGKNILDFINSNIFNSGNFNITLYLICTFISYIYLIKTKHEN